MFMSPALRMLAFFMCSSGCLRLGRRRARFILLVSLFKALDVSLFYRFQNSRPYWIFETTSVFTIFFFLLTVSILFLSIGCSLWRVSCAARILANGLTWISSVAVLSTPRYLKVFTPLMVSRLVSSSSSTGMLLKRNFSSATATAVVPFLLRTNAVPGPRHCALCPTRASFDGKFLETRGAGVFIDQ
eukprot:snap_masked-scaffold_25-processed-gene-3.5-mRNA-1 protein AED:1.00 eAED:1.00 QI:0/-1/0/0/-1/1/1/0/186